MSKHWFLFLLMLWIGTSGTLQSNVIIEGDVIVSNSLPDWARVCVATEVRGNPRESSTPIYSVSVGERVRIHDQSKPDGTWVSIAKARWIPLKSLCR